MRFIIIIIIYLKIINKLSEKLENAIEILVDEEVCGLLTLK